MVVGRLAQWKLNFGVAYGGVSVTWGILLDVFGPQAALVFRVPVPTHGQCGAKRAANSLKQEAKPAIHAWYSVYVST